jgi:uncharacterized membrane protein YdbT with pleckstrin-like domain
MSVCTNCFLSVETMATKCDPCAVEAGMATDDGARRHRLLRGYVLARLLIVAALAIVALYYAQTLPLGLLVALIATAFVARAVRATEPLTR